MLQFLRNGDKVARGFRVSKDDERLILASIGRNEGSLIVNVVDVGNGEKSYGLKAIWTSGKIRLVDQRFVANETGSYVVELVSAVPRKRGEIF